MGKGNGNNQDYAELVITACSGDTAKVVYDEPAFRDSRAKANIAMASLSMVGLAGHPVGDYQVGSTLQYFEGMPEWAHLTRVEINKLNHQSDKVRPYTFREYDCEHTKEPA